MCDRREPSNHTLLAFACSQGNAVNTVVPHMVKDFPLGRAIIEVIHETRQPGVLQKI